MLPYEDDADRRANLQSLGELVRVDGTEGYGIITEPYDAADLGDGVSVENRPRTLSICEVDFPDVELHSLVERGNDRWVVIAPPERDGTGIVRLRLQAE